MVCLGNICRSPLAEGLLASKLPKDKFIVDSAGTGSWHIGSLPDERSIDVAKRNGLDISYQRGRQFKPADFDEFDYIYVMDSENLRNVKAMARNEAEKSKVKLILDELFPGENMDVPDPYFGLHDGFNRVYGMLDEATANLAEKLQSKHP